MADSELSYDRHLNEAPDRGWATCAAGAIDELPCSMGSGIHGLRILQR